MSEPAVTYESCLANSLKALELDPNLAEAHAARAWRSTRPAAIAEATRNSSAP